MKGKHPKGKRLSYIRLLNEGRARTPDGESERDEPLKEGTRSQYLKKY